MRTGACSAGLDARLACPELPRHEAPTFLTHSVQPDITAAHHRHLRNYASPTLCRREGDPDAWSAPQCLLDVCDTSIRKPPDARLLFRLPRPTRSLEIRRSPPSQLPQPRGCSGIQAGNDSCLQRNRRENTVHSFAAGSSAGYSDEGAEHAWLLGGAGWPRLEKPQERYEAVAGTLRSLRGGTQENLARV